MNNQKKRQRIRQFEEFTEVFVVYFLMLIAKNTEHVFKLTLASFI